MTLTKADLIQQVYDHDQHEGLTKSQAIESVEAFLRISNSRSWCVWDKGKD